MKESYPHEYTLAGWDELELFRASILSIERWG